MKSDPERNWAWKPEKPVRTAVKRGDKKVRQYMKSRYGQPPKSAQP